MRGRILGVVKLVVPSPAVAGREIEHAVRSERHAAAIVIGRIVVWNSDHRSPRGLEHVEIG